MVVTSENLTTTVARVITLHAKECRARDRFDYACDVDAENCADLELAWNDLATEKDALLDDLVSFAEARLVPRGLDSSSR